MTSPASTPRARRRAGLSLIEMMFALVILAGGLLAMLTGRSTRSSGHVRPSYSEAMQSARTM